MSTALPEGVSAGEPGDYRVVARKYRPQGFETLVGQEHVVRGLTAAIETQRVGHAYLFTGARGTGKTSTARIFAKALNCVRGPTATPCNACDICREIAEGRDIDVVEIDGASNRGIDDVRQLRANVAIRPSRARYKVYIVDEVHMFTTESFNALLKTLEEPPEHVKFLLCTTDPEKLPITVRSRCQRFDFAPVATEEIQKQLAEICRREGVSADPAALHLLARRAAGSMRDSQSLLEQLLSVCSQQQITSDDVHRMLGTAQGGRLTSLVANLTSRNAAAALAGVDDAVRAGVDVGQLAEQLLGYLRDMLTAVVGGSADIMLHILPEEYDHLLASGKQLGSETLLAMLQILDQALVRMRQSVHPRVLLEVALVRMCQLEALDDLAAVLGQLQSGTPPTSPPIRPAASAPPAARAEVPTLAPQKKTAGPVAEVVEPNVQSPTATPLREENLAEVWQQVVAALGDMTGDMIGQAVRLAISGPNRLVVTLPAAYIREYCERPTNRSRIEQALAAVVGGSARVDFDVAPAVPKPAEAVAPAPSKRQLMMERQRHPLVQQALEVFQAEMVEVVEPRRS